MKIKILDIYGYGKWVKTTFQLNDQLQVFYGPNEAGKSTLQSFIRSILFGFPTRRKRINMQNRYEPKEGNRYGGRLLITDTVYGDLWIERTDETFSITTVDGEQLDDSVLEQVLAGLDEKLFDTFYGFNVQNLQELNQLTADQLNDYFLSIGTVGSDQFLKIAKQLEKESDELFRPTAQARPLNQMLEEFDVLATNIEKLKQEMSQYQHLLKEQTEIDEVLRQTQEKIEQFEKMLRQKDQIIQRYEYYLKDQAIQRQLEELVYTPIPKGSAEQLHLSRSTILNNESEKELLKEKIQLIEGELGTLTRFKWAINHQDQREQWLKETYQAKETQTKIEQYEQRIHEQQQVMEQLASKGHFYPEKVENTQEYFEKLDQGLVLQAEKFELLQEEEVLRTVRKLYIDQRKDQQHYSGVVRSQIAQLESQRMNQEAQLITETSLKHYLPGVILVVIGINFLILYFIESSFKSTAFMWIAVLALLSSVASVGFTFFKHRKKFQEFYNSPIIGKIQELREKELNYQEQSRQIGIQINEREQKLEDLSKKIEKVTQNLQKWLVSIGFFPTADAELVLKTNPVKSYFEAVEKKEQLTEKLAHYQEQVKNWRRLVQPLFERFPFNEESIRSQIRHVEEIESQLKVTQYRGQTLLSQKENYQETINQLETKIQTHQEMINRILAETNCANEVEFDQRVQDNQTISELENKHVMYLEQLKDYQEELSKITSKQSLIEDYQRLEQHLLQEKQLLTPYHRKRANLQVKIQHLEEDGTYSDLLQQYAIKKEALRQLVLKWATKRLSMEILYHTLRYGIEDPLPVIIKRANEIFETLSYGRYTQIKLNQQQVKVVQFSGILFEVHELSQGTLEQLYIALRLAFVESAQSIVKLPIIIDDAFVNFDDRRKSSMYQVLQEMSKSIQILFFTFDPKAHEVFDQKTIIQLQEVSQEVSQDDEETTV